METRSVHGRSGVWWSVRWQSGKPARACVIAGNSSIRYNSWDRDVCCMFELIPKGSDTTSPSTKWRNQQWSSSSRRWRS